MKLSSGNPSIFLLAIASFVVVLFLSFSASADVYVYRDTDGVLTFKNQPCTEEQRLEGCSRVLRDRQWKWDSDANHDGKVTVSDVFGWLKWIYYYPGDWLIHAMLNEKGSRGMAEFFELTPESYGGWGSFAISLFAWWTLLYGIATFPDELMEDGRKLTSQLKKWRNCFKRSLN